MIAGAAGAAAGVRALAAARVGSYGNEYPDMLVAYLANGLDRLARQWDGVRGGLRTASDVASRNDFVREKMRLMLGPAPERVPLQARVTGAVRRPGYRIENVRFQSRPDFWITANLYVPEGAAGGPMPAIVSPCGHYETARMYPDYQFAYQNLARAGFVVLAYDPMGQGERRHFLDPRTGETEAGMRATIEHSLAGQLLMLVGESAAGWHVWDGMRAVDYLVSRPEVDAGRIGCAGHSGGGTVTLMLGAVEPRIKAAVVNEGGTMHRWPVDLARIGPSDVEQNLFPGASYGIDACDVHVAIAPRPLLVLIENYTAEFNRTAEHIRRRFEQLGAAERFRTEEAVDDHAWTYRLRQATTDWFCRWFLGHGGPEREPAVVAESRDTLRVAPVGGGTGRDVFSLLRERAARVPGRAVSAERLRELLRLESQPGVPLSERRLAVTGRKGYTIERSEFLSEAGVYIPVSLFVADGGSARAPVLFLDEAGRNAKAREGGPFEQIALKGQPVMAVDLRGIGETRIGREGGGGGGFTHVFNAETAASYMAWYMDRSLFGMRVGDVMRCVDYMLARWPGDQRVKTVGVGMGGLWALFAAALDRRIESVVAIGALASYRMLAEADRYLHGADILVPGLLREFDLPEIVAAIAPRAVTIAGPVDAMKRPLEGERAAACYSRTADAYARAGAARAFRVVAEVREWGVTW
jgi:cephalosporin-C deacetylase-like acetyl esterase